MSEKMNMNFNRGEQNENRAERKVSFIDSAIERYKKEFREKGDNFDNKK